jgi:hypothetical protein
VVANRDSNAVAVLTNDTHWGPAPRPAGHEPTEQATFVAALPDIGLHSAPAPLPLTTSPADGTLLPAVLDNPPGSTAIPTWERATSRPLEPRDAASQVTDSRDLLCAGWDKAWLADVFVEDPNLA